MGHSFSLKKRKKDWVFIAGFCLFLKTELKDWWLRLNLERKTLILTLSRAPTKSLDVIHLPPPPPALYCCTFMIVLVFILFLVLINLDFGNLICYVQRRIKLVLFWCYKIFTLSHWSNTLFFPPSMLCIIDCLLVLSFCWAIFFMNMVFGPASIHLDYLPPAYVPNKCGHQDLGFASTWIWTWNHMVFLPLH